MKVLLSVLLAGLFAGAKCNGQGNGQEQSWIDRLKNTPVARIEAGLPEKPFDQWLAQQSKAAQPKYELGDCDSEGGASGKCITVSAEVAPIRKMELMFAVPQDKAGAVCTFVRGTIGPSDPRSKQPTRLVRKLGELEAMLR
jgi:hypothetical protein